MIIIFWHYIYVATFINRCWCLMLLTIVFVFLRTLWLLILNSEITLRPSVWVVKFNFPTQLSLPVTFKKWTLERRWHIQLLKASGYIIQPSTTVSNSVPHLFKYHQKCHFNQPIDRKKLNINILSTVHFWVFDVHDTSGLPIEMRVQTVRNTNKTFVQQRESFKRSKLHTI